MAGQNKVFKEGDILFRQGDAADCMYLVRKGSLSVYIPKDDGDLKLASLDSGSIVGEMAFFDNKPRSASVKAAETTEVTQITRADFDKLLTQIPKWMVTMMQSLSGRLRSTNERLQKLEEASLAANPAGAGSIVLPNQKFPFQIMLKTLRTINLSMLKDGEKDGREQIVSLSATQDLWNDLVAEEQAIFERALAKLVHLGLIALKKNSLKQDIIALTNRGGFAQLADFISKYGPKFTHAKPFLEPAALEFFAFLVDTTVTSGYETLNVNINELSAHCKSKGIDTTKWGSTLPELVKKLELKLSKNGANLLVKVVTKEHKQMKNCLDQMADLLKSNLA